MPVTELSGRPVGRIAAPQPQRGLRALTLRHSLRPPGRATGDSGAGVVPRLGSRVHRHRRDASGGRRQPWPWTPGPASTG